MLLLLMESSASIHHVFKNKKATTPHYRVWDDGWGGRFKTVFLFLLDPEFLLGLLNRCCLLQASNTVVDQMKKLSTYLFRTEIGGHVQFSVKEDEWEIRNLCRGLIHGTGC
ncbi:hypothetical protein OIU77_010837 [Salix suchowensis]|uniref:Uncharacterized protein n=1 Tax=Salix suchowensis TaxID=1278906 RepID=A0ABQ9ABY8_9ROSI|nr:hypothetical protein OIU77_010837 [Salix suchowensis]